MQRNRTTFQNLTSDPYLQYQPHFARSLAVQLLIAGVVLTLTTTLLVQLCFTWQYHWPLARINWTLQFTAVCTLLLNIMAIMYVVLNALAEKSKEWPYMFEYVAIDVPRVGAWSIPEIAAWYVMEAGTSALASITHIQFLTFLYPSRLEARLVFLLLGPLALVASIMTLLPISTYSNFPNSMTLNSTCNETLSHINSSSLETSSDVRRVTATGSANYVRPNQQQLYDIIDAARNICNLTLSLLFTVSLLIWGFLVNRKSAWRTDGGTAAFGAGALFLALVSTGLNFLNVFISFRLAWLSSLLWAVVLWQSFLGWWWWVGSAGGIVARDLDLDRRGKKEQKRMKRNRHTVPSNEDESVVIPVGRATARLERRGLSAVATFTRHKPAAIVPITTSQSQTSAFPAESIELSPISSNRSAPRHTHPHSPVSSIPASNASSHTMEFFSTVRQAWNTLRQAHVRAARVQAIEQRQIQLQMQLENRRGFGRFPVGERDSSISGCDGTTCGESGEKGSPQNSGQHAEVGHQRGKLMLNAEWWWGPLKKWRLRDSTRY